MQSKLNYTTTINTKINEKKTKYIYLEMPNVISLTS